MENVDRIDMFSKKRWKILEKKALASFIESGGIKRSLDLSIQLGNSNFDYSVPSRKERSKNGINKPHECIIKLIEGQLINKYEKRINKMHKLFLKGNTAEIFKALKTKKLNKLTTALKDKTTTNQQQEIIKIEKQLIVYKDSTLLDLINNPLKPIETFKVALIRNQCIFCKQLCGINYKEHVFLVHQKPTATLRDFYEIRTTISIHLEKTKFNLKVKNNTTISDIKKYMSQFLNKSTRQIHLKTPLKILKNKEKIGEINETEFLLFFKSQA